LLLVVALYGCGGGKGTTDKLFTYRAGSKWVYQFSGTVTLPADQGGGTQNVQANSTLTLEVLSATFKDLNNQDVNILERAFDLKLLDGRTLRANLRLYVSQSNLGLFVHGTNNWIGNTFDQTRDRFVPAGANPPFKFLYLPSPVADGTTVTYANPFLATPAAGFELQAVGPRQQTQVPAGDFLARLFAVEEGFNQFKLLSGRIAPDVGIISGTLDLTLSDGTRINGTIRLQSVNL
jgi:hypothetical protein